MKNMTLSIFMMGKILLGKDVECVPRILGSLLSMNVDIVSLRSPWNANFPSVLNGVNYKFLLWNCRKKPKYYKLIAVWLYLIKNAKKIDLFMRFHYGIPSAIEIIIYKIFNKNGIAYCKLDTGDIIFTKFTKMTGIKGFIIKPLIKLFIKKTDIFSCETKAIYNNLKTMNNNLLPNNDKLLYIPNGFDNSLIRNIHINKYYEKEDIILSVGRHGSYQKNSELLLDAIDGMDLRSWKVIFIGTTTNDFENKLNRIKNKNPTLNIFSLGPIYDKLTLFNYYNKAKVFVLTSRDESSGIVLNEAFRFNNFIISTKVGAAPDIISPSNNGLFIENGSLHQLRKIIYEVTHDQIDISKSDRVEFNLSWDNVLKPLKDRILSLVN